MLSFISVPVRTALHTRPRDNFPSYKLAIEAERNLPPTTKEPTELYILAPILLPSEAPACEAPSLYITTASVPILNVTARCTHAPTSPEVTTAEVVVHVMCCPASNVPSLLTVSCNLSALVRRHKYAVVARSESPLEKRAMFPPTVEGNCSSLHQISNDKFPERSRPV